MARFRQARAPRPRACATSLLLAAILAGTAAQARAFEIFGFKFFEKDEETTDIVDPLRYTAR